MEAGPPELPLAGCARYMPQQHQQLEMATARMLGARWVIPVTVSLRHQHPTHIVHTMGSYPTPHDVHCTLVSKQLESQRSPMIPGFFAGKKRCICRSWVKWLDGHLVDEPLNSRRLAG